MESGFTQSNALIWPVSLQKCIEMLKLRGFKPLSLEEADTLRQVNHDLIQNSNLKIILMCGDNVRYIVFVAGSAGERSPSMDRGFR